MSNSSLGLNRLAQLQQQIPADTWWLISNSHDIWYFTGLNTTESPEREAWLFVSREKALFCHTPFLSISLAGIQQIASLRFQEILPQIINVNTSDSVTRSSDKMSIHFDTADLSFHEYEALQRCQHPLEHLDRSAVWQLRQVKESDEIANIREACQITSVVMKELIESVQPGITEQEVLLLCQQKILQQGAQLAFPPVIAFGSATALPHHRPSQQKLMAEVPVMFDFGARVNGYCGDMTRTIWFGEEPIAEFVKIEQVVTAAYEAAIKEAHAGTSVAKVDLAARDLITNAGYGKQYVHTTGHGLGLEIHEPPSLYHTQSQLLEKNMVITIEPGIYLPGKFGYRYENTLMVTDGEPEVLT